MSLLADLLGSPKQESKRLRQLGLNLDLSGLGEVLDTLPVSGGSRQLLGRLVGELNRTAAAAVRLLFLNESVCIHDLEPELADALEVLADMHILTFEGERCLLATMRMHRVLGLWYIAERESCGASLYLGDDSAALAKRLVDGRARVLDLCAGPGIQGLTRAAQGSSVVAVDANPVAVWLGGVNAALNALEDKIEFRSGDLYEAVGKDERFDLICANPPLLPIPIGFEYPFVGDGGPDGMQVTRRILLGLGRHLADNGVAQVLGVTLSDSIAPTCWPELHSLLVANGLGAQWTTVHRFDVVSPAGWCAMVAETALRARDCWTQDESRALARGLVDAYRGLGANSVESYYLRVTRQTTNVLRHDLSALTSSCWELDGGYAG